MTTLPIDVLTQRAQSRPESTAFVFEHEVWTYRRLAVESTRVAHGLAAMGVRAGDRVVLQKAPADPFEDPFATFTEWASDLDKVYDDL